jgi:hypothetical protein
MLELGWTSLGKTREADQKGVDATFKLGYATIYLQIKSANFITEFANDPKRKPYRRWHWEIFEKGKQLLTGFYTAKIPSLAWSSSHVG